MKHKRRITIVSCFIIVLCVFLSGCTKKEDVLNTQKEEASQESDTKKGGTITGNTPKKHVVLPKNKEEEEAFLGKTDKSGEWTPPKESYTDKDGLIYNKDGVIIGGPQKWKIRPGGKG